MIMFNCDYAEGAHPRILERLSETNFDQTLTYGLDVHSDRARSYIRAACGLGDEAPVHFFTGGTQANLTVIDAMLLPYQGVVSTETGHINVHETGAVEATGRKILTLPPVDGKIPAASLREYCEAHYADHDRDQTVQPGMVYISHPTECGTLYTLAELEALRAVCDEFGLILYLDGARLGYGLAVPGSVTLRDIARLCDVFYIGGTKLGAMFGEAVVIARPELGKCFRYSLKRRGAMLAKGRMLGIQFEVLFEDGLYFEIAQHAVALADELRLGCRDAGLELLYDTAANQLFPIMPDAVIAKLQEKYRFFAWERVDSERSAARLCTSWCTPEENVAAFLGDLRAALK